MLHLVIGDPHCKPDNLDKLYKLTNEVELYGLPAIWLGDQLDTKEVIRGKCLNFWYNYYKNSKLDHIVLVGNHDWHNKECEEHSLEVLKSLPNVTIVDTPMQINGVSFLPYHKQNVLLDYIKKDNADLVFAHLDLIGFDYGNGIISKEGLNSLEFNKYKLVISGHYHKYQRKNNIIYLGTPFSHNYGESNQSKYLMKINTKTIEYNIIETFFPSHITIEIDCDKSTELKKEIKEHNYNRIILKGLQSNIDKFDKNKYNFVKYIEKPTIEMQGVLIEESLDHEAQFKKWAKEKNIDESILNKGIEVLKNV